MKLLALDTSSIACSVALQNGDTVIDRHEEKAREHTKLLVPMMRSVLADAGLEIAELDAVVLGNGPGSFIGMRIAASVAQGVAFGAGLRIAPVSSMLAVAAETVDQHDVAEVVVTQDAHMSEVYLGIYRVDEAGVARPAFDESLQAQEPIAAIEEPARGRRVAAGFGWQRYPELLAMNEGRFDELAGVWHPHARYLLPYGVDAVRNGKVIAPEDVVPAYLRQKVAQKPPERRP